VRIIRAGDVGEDVRDVQHRLVTLGTPIEPDELDGRFGPSTQAAVRSFQGERRLPVDGVRARLGPAAEKLPPSATAQNTSSSRARSAESIAIFAPRSKILRVFSN